MHRDRSCVVYIGDSECILRLYALAVLQPTRKFLPRRVHRVRRNGRVQGWVAHHEVTMQQDDLGVCPLPQRASQHHRAGRTLGAAVASRLLRRQRAVLSRLVQRETQKGRAALTNTRTYSHPRGRPRGEGLCFGCGVLVGMVRVERAYCINSINSTKDHTTTLTLHQPSRLYRS